MAWIDTLAQAVDAISSTAIHNLGDRCIRAGKEYLYCVDSGSGITQYHAVTIDTSYSATSITKANADKNYLVGVSQVTVTASYYFWCLVRGAGTILTKSACASECMLFTTATAGTLDDTGTSQTGIANIHLTATAATAAASANTTCFLNYPKAFAGETVVDVAQSVATAVSAVALSNQSSVVSCSVATSDVLLETSSAMSSASIADSKALLAYSAGSSAMSSASIGASNALLAYSAGSSAMSSASIADSKALLAYSAGSSAMSSASIADSKALLAYSAGSSAMSSASIGASNALLAYSAGSSAMSSCSVAQSHCTRIDLVCSAYADSAVANSHSNAASAALQHDADYLGLCLSVLVSGISSAVGKNF